MFPSFLPFGVQLFLFLFVFLPFRILELVSYLPYYPLNKIGLGDFYERKHYIFTENIHQFILQPKNYLKRRKFIHAQIVKESKELKK